MLVVEYEPVVGWGTPRIMPYRPLELDPSSHCLHYSSNLFEGMKVSNWFVSEANSNASDFKAYIGSDSVPLLFRPDMNVARMTRSAERLALPPFNPDALFELIKALVLVEKRWIPQLPGYSLYIRPCLIGTRPALGPMPSNHATLFIIVSPTGPFFKHGGAGVKPVSLYASFDHVRAWPGGTGAFKLGGNYAPTFMPAYAAAQQGYQQILWLLEDVDSQNLDTIEANGAVDVEKKSSEMRITEAGQMNFFAVVIREDGGLSQIQREENLKLNFIVDLDLVTPPLDGTVLPGVTRDSCLELAKYHNLPSDDPLYVCLPGIPAAKRVYPRERNITIEELARLNTAGRVLEAFGAGTAAVICPIGRVGYRHKDILFQEHPGGYGPVSKALVETLEGIFVGKVKSAWSIRCE